MTEYQFDGDEDAFYMTGISEIMQDYVVNTLGYTEYNQAVSNLEDISNKIKAETGNNELTRNDIRKMVGDYGNTQFSNENTFKKHYDRVDRVLANRFWQ